MTAGDTAPAAAAAPSASFYDRYRRGRSRLTMSLNLTPMIDVVFNLLFFFLVISRFGAEGMLPAQLPAWAVGATAEVPRTPLRIRFVSGAGGADCSVTVDRFQETPQPIATLIQTLKAIRNSQPAFDARTPVYLLAGDHVPWDDVVNAYNAAYGAGYQKILFVDSP